MTSEFLSPGRLPAVVLAAAMVLSSFVWSCSRNLRAAPDFALKDRDGREVCLSDYRGKVVALNFWATWCGPCSKEVPWLNRLAAENVKRGFAVIGISTDEQGWPVVKPYLTKLKVNYDVVLDDRRISSLYGTADVVPTTILIDREGRIAGSYAGVVNRKAFENSLEQLLKSRNGRTGDSKCP